MNLEVRVNENITIYDTVVQAMEYITETIRVWYESTENNELNIVLKKNMCRAPPVLGISVGEVIEIKDRLV